MRLILRTLTGPQFTIEDVNPTDSIRSVMKKLEEQDSRFPPERQRLITMDGIELEPDKFVSSYPQLCDGYKITFLIRFVIAGDRFVGGLLNKTLASSTSSMATMAEEDGVLDEEDESDPGDLVSAVRDEEAVPAADSVRKRKREAGSCDEERSAKRRKTGF